MKEKNKAKIQTILTDIKELKQKLESITLSLESITNDQEGIEINVYDIRKIAILEEVYRSDGIVSAEQLSDIAKKWGKSPQGVAGYFTGDNPSLRSIAGGKRALTDKGADAVIYYRDKYGDDWLDKVNLDLVGNSNTPDDIMITI